MKKNSQVALYLTKLVNKFNTTAASIGIDGKISPPSVYDYKVIVRQIQDIDAHVEGIEQVTLFAILKARFLADYVSTLELQMKPIDMSWVLEPL